MAGSRSPRSGGARQAPAWARRHNEANFPELILPAAALLELIGGPAALWSGDRASCLFSHAAAELFGCEAGDANSWSARIDPADRGRFGDFCRAVPASPQRSRCRYRFARAGSGVIELHETAERIDPPRGAPMILSRYAVAGEERRMAHQIGNHLQAVRGELDLLRLSGALPEQAAAAVFPPLDAVHELVQKIGKPPS